MKRVAAVKKKSRAESSESDIAGEVCWPRSGCLVWYVGLILVADEAQM